MQDTPVELVDFKLFLETLSTWLEADSSAKVKSIIARYLVRRIEISPDGMQILFMAGETYVKCLLASTPKGPQGGGLRKREKSEKVYRSNTLTFGDAGTT